MQSVLPALPPTPQVGSWTEWEVLGWVGAGAPGGMKAESSAPLPKSLPGV